MNKVIKGDRHSVKISIGLTMPAVLIACAYDTSLTPHIRWDSCYVSHVKHAFLSGLFS